MSRHDTEITAAVEMSLDAGSLKRAVTLCRRATDSRASVPILRFIKLQVEADGSVWSTGTDLDIEVRAAISGSGHGACTLPARTVALRKILEAKDAAVRAFLFQEAPHV